MRLSRYFLPILRETPKEAEIVSHRLMLRAGLIRQQAAGIYSWLPLGQRVLAKIEQIVREEQNRAGAIEILMPTIQPADLWRESGRYDDYGKEMLRIKDRHERDMLFGPTNEEMVTEIFRAYVHSYRELPLNLYHIQWKFRDEVRPRFGVMRGREFLMKDAYSFDIDAEAARHAYNRMFVAYLRTFDRLGLKAIPMRADTGPDRRRHEPRIHHPRRDRRERGLSARAISSTCRSRAPTPTSAADLTPIVEAWTSPLRGDRRDARRRRASPRRPGGRSASRARGIEVGHIFYFGTKYSKPMGAKVAGRRRQPSTSSTWAPTASACRGWSARSSRRATTRPASSGRTASRRSTVGLINLKPGDAATDAAAEALYERLTNAGIDVLYDDRRRAGRGEVRDDGPDRAALAGDRRSEGRRAGRGRDEAARDRRTRDALARCGS